MPLHKGMRVIGCSRYLHVDLLLGGDRKPDSDKTREELIKELTQLRDVWRLDQGEIKKLHKVGQGTAKGA